MVLSLFVLRDDTLLSRLACVSIVERQEWGDSEGEETGGIAAVGVG
jgi:hypothetical protein